jgi:predicted nucleotidyltransferase
MLEYFITSGAKRSVLKLFLTNPDAPFHINEVARLTGEPVNAIAREVRSLEKAGLLSSKKVGNQIQFVVQKGFPLYKELKKIIYATVGLGDYLAQNLSDWDTIEIAFIYGSVAGNNEISGSDVDLMLIGSAAEDDVHRVIRQVENDTGRNVNYTLIQPQEFRQRLKQKEPFIARVMREKRIALKGDPDGHR